MGIFSGFAGTQNGRFFGILPPFVDKKLAPGCSVLPKPTFMDWLSAIPFVMWNTPNTVWGILAIIFYFAFPYDLSRGSAAARSPLSLEFFQERFPLWATLTFGYTAFWHVTLYFLGWSDRPFLPSRIYSLTKVSHNLFWSFMGITIWVGFENVFAFLWASGRLPYVSDADSLGSVSGIFWFIVVLCLTPVWRDFHFYFAHRLLHFGPIYKQVHSLHHRNTDIEPFAGLCMHPIEHLYYYACILPSLLFVCTPFAFLWNGVHLLLAPGASHSGFEDHFQADAFHYMHHRYFECNYAGFNAAFLDVMFDTFVEKFTPNDRRDARPDAKSNLLAPLTPEFATYLTLACGCVAAWAYAAVGVAQGAFAVSSVTAQALALAAGFGPVLAAVAVSSAFSSAGGTALVDPKRFWGSLAQWGVGTAFCAFPVYLACSLAF